MTFRLDEVVPWGRTLAEYRAMFDFTDDDMSGTVLGCGDGPASFNAESTRLGYRVTSSDPIYRFSAAELRSRINETADIIAKQLQQNAHEFVWSRFSGPGELIDARMAAMREFLADYPLGLSEGRYVEAALPDLPFSDRSFDLVVCSHFLFLYSQQRDLGFHLNAINELCRVAAEVRIFPLLELGSVTSRHLDAIVAALREKSHSVEIVPVDYEMQKGGNQMLRVVPGYRQG